MARERRRGRGLIGALVALLVILAILWAGYWYVARTLALNAIARATTSGTAASQLACTGLNLGGFPLYLDVRCDRGTFSGRGEAVTAALGGVAATVPLFRPGHVEAQLSAPFVVDAPDRGIALTANWADARTTADAWIGGLTGFQATFDTLTAANAANAAGLPLNALAAHTASVSLRPANGNSFTFSGAATELVLTLAGGRTFPTIDAEADLTAVGVGSTLGTNPARTLRAWAKQGGELQIDKVKIAAAGAVVVLGGKLNLSATGLLNGSVLVRYNDIGKVADLLEAIRPGTRERFATPLDALNSVTVAADTPDGPMHQTTVSFIDGSVWLGIIPLPVDPLPPVKL